MSQSEEKNTPVKPLSDADAEHLKRILPNLIGAIHHTIESDVKQRLPFVLVVFDGARAYHATNARVDIAHQLLVSYLAGVAQPVSTGEGDAS